MTDFILIAIIYTIASFTQGAAGFGFGIFSVPLLSMLFSPGMAVGMNAVTGTVNCVYTYFIMRRYVQYRKSIAIIAFSSIFIPAGAYFLIKVNQYIVFLVMGIMITAVALHKYYSQRKENHIYIYKKYGFLFQIGAGLVAGAFVAPGPVLAPYVYAKEKDPYIAKADLQFIFSIMSIFIIISHAAAGNLTSESLKTALPFVPLVFIFTRLGAWYAFRINKKIFGKIINVALLALGLYVTIKNVIPLITG